MSMDGKVLPSRKVEIPAGKDLPRVPDKPAVAVPPMHKREGFERGDEK